MLSKNISDVNFSYLNQLNLNYIEDNRNKIYIHVTYIKSTG